MSRLVLNKGAAPSNPTANKVALYLDQAAPGVGTTIKPVVIDESGNKLVLGGLGIQDYRLIRVTNILTGTVTFTPSNGARALFVECIGAGGAGGGAALCSTQVSVGSGGGGGAYSAKWITGTLKASYTVAVGAGGTAGGAGAAGNAGGDTTFDSPSVCTAKGGAGGAVMAAGTTLIGQAGTLGGASASGVGDIKSDGCAGEGCIRLSTTGGLGGNGGAGFPTGGNGLGAAVAGVGTAALSYGGGGGGSMATSTAQVGGVGFAGLIRIWEFA